MSTFGWILILFAVIVGKLAAQGRSVKDVPADLGDIVTGAVTGDYAKVQDVLNRTGTENAFTGASAVGGTTSQLVDADTGIAKGTAGGSSATGLRLLAEMERLGNGKRYVLGTTGPDSYDCSGLVWRAMKNLGIYDGPRFVTATWQGVAKQLNAVEVPASEPGAVAWWPGHMGVVQSGDRYYSARSPKYGISMASLETTRTSRGASSTRFWRLP